MKKRNLIYITIIVICVISIIVAVYYQIFLSNEDSNNGNVITSQNTNQNQQNNAVKVDLEKTKIEFNSLFNNKLEDQGYSLSAVKKIKGLEAEDVIYTAYDINLQEEGQYDVKLKVPVFNIDGEIPGQVNVSTQAVFANKANDIFANSKTKGYSIYNIDYAAFLNENILSLVIRATLKEGDNAQRLIVQTHNYDINTGKSLTLNEVLSEQGILYKDVNKKIEEYIIEANKQAEAVSMAVTGQAVYKRDVNNAMYTTDNSNYFFLGLDGQIYILYPYGNSNFTSEIDIIKL